MNTIIILIYFSLLRCCYFGFKIKLITRQNHLSLDFLREQITSLKSSTELTITENNSIEKLPYDWKKQWYAVTYESNIPKVNDKKPLSFSIFDVELVFWRDQWGRVVCTEDKCPHRGTRLSEGQVDTKTGQIECLYHGWKFEGADGKCATIPQLSAGGTIPMKACLITYATAVNEGILFVWMDKPETADYVNLPKTRVDLDSPATKKAFSRYDFQYDLPYDHSYLVENLLDPAHIPVSHDRTNGGGLKENAQALDIILKSNTDIRTAAFPFMNAQGFTSTVTQTRAPVTKSKLNNPIRKLLSSFAPKSQDPTVSQTEKSSSRFFSQEITFEAPGIIRYHFERGNFMFGAALHCVAVGEGRSRLLFTTFLKAPKLLQFIANLKPVWVKHLNSCKVLEQDVGLITSQEDILMKLNTYKQYALTSKSKLAPTESDGILRLNAINPADEWLPLSSCDTILVQYRKWLDSVGHGMPYYQGWRTRRSLSSSTVIATQPAGVVYPHNANTHTRDPAHRMHSSRFYNHVIHHKPTLNVLKKVIFWKHFFQSLLAVSGLSSISLASLSITNLPKVLSFLSPSLVSKLSILNKVFLVVSVIASLVLQKTESLFYTNYKRHNY